MLEFVRKKEFMNVESDLIKPLIEFDKLDQLSALKWVVTPLEWLLKGDYPEVTI